MEEDRNSEPTSVGTSEDDISGDLWSIRALAIVGQESAFRLQESGLLKPSDVDRRVDPLHRLFELIEEKADKIINVLDTTG